MTGAARVQSPPSSEYSALVDVVQRVGGVPAHTQLSAVAGSRQAGDPGRRVVDGEGVAHQAAGERLGRWIGRRVRSGDAQPVLAVGKGRGVEGEILLGHLLLERLPARSPWRRGFPPCRSANRHWVGGQPARAARSPWHIAWPACGGGGVDSREKSGEDDGARPSGGSDSAGGRRKRRRGRRRELVVGLRDLDLLHARRQVLGQVRHVHRFQFRRVAGAIALQRGLPLHEARRRRGDASALRAGDRRRPRTPVLLRLIQVAAARLDGHLSAVEVRFEAQPAPQRKHGRIEDVALDGAFVFQPGPIWYTLPTLPVAAYNRPPGPLRKAVTCVAGMVTSAVYCDGDSMR